MRSLRLRSRGDRGAVAVLVGILLGLGVLLGMTALVVDVGIVYHERAQLQSGAEGGALAVAKACAAGNTVGCTSDIGPAGTARGYADANAKDGASAVDLVCGQDEYSVLPACPGSGGRMIECPVEVPDHDYVEVHTSTLADDGTTLLPPVLAQALTGNEDYDGTTVGACARVGWGPPKTANTVAMTISHCEWQQATNGDTTYAPPPPYPPDPDAVYGRVLRLHDPQMDSSTSGNDDDESCSDDKAVDGPGMFGWVDDPDGNCEAFIDGGQYSSDPGASAGKSCKQLLEEARETREPIFIPIYKSVEGTGTNGTYEFDRFAAFVVTGYHLPGLKALDWLNPDNDCKGSEKCINGFFTQSAMPSSGEIGGPDGGAYIVKLVG